MFRFRLWDPCGTHFFLSPKRIFGAVAHTPSAPSTPISTANRPSFIGAPGRACSPTRAHPGKGTTRPQTPPYVGTFRFRFRDQFRDHFSTFRRSAFSLPWPTRATRPRRRAPPLTDRHLSVISVRRSAKHARARGKEPRDLDYSMPLILIVLPRNWRRRFANNPRTRPKRRAAAKRPRVR